MGKLHELLAAEEDARGTAKKILSEGIKTFKDKDQHFDSKLLVFQPVEENAADEVEGETVMVETISGKVKYICKIFGKYLDAVYQKELTNSEAKADIVLSDGTELAKDVPATALLSIEKELAALMVAYNAIPTLAPAIPWTDCPDKGKGIRENIDIRKRTKKVEKHEVIVPPTDKHPAQVAKITQDVVIGNVKAIVTTSKLTPAEKSDLIARINEVKTAVKKARMRANRQEVKVQKIADNLFDYINKDLV